MLANLATTRQIITIDRLVRARRSGTAARDHAPQGENRMGGFLFAPPWRCPDGPESIIALSLNSNDGYRARFVTLWATLKKQRGRLGGSLLI
jgi:hypothetical protein